MKLTPEAQIQTFKIIQIRTKKQMMNMKCESE